MSATGPRVTASKLRVTVTDPLSADESSAVFQTPGHLRKFGIELIKAHAPVARDQCQQISSAATGVMYTWHLSPQCTST